MANNAELRKEYRKLRRQIYRRYGGRLRSVSWPTTLNTVSLVVFVPVWFLSFLPVALQPMQSVFSLDVALGIFVSTWLSTGLIYAVAVSIHCVRQIYWPVLPVIALPKRDSIAQKVLHASETLKYRASIMELHWWLEVGTRLDEDASQEAALYREKANAMRAVADALLDSYSRHIQQVAEAEATMREEIDSTIKKQDREIGLESMRSNYLVNSVSVETAINNGQDILEEVNALSRAFKELGSMQEY